MIRELNESFYNSFNINLNVFNDTFSKWYNFLYDNNDNYRYYDNAVETFDSFAKHYKDFVSRFVKYRGDFISSDREAASFILALSELAPKANVLGITINDFNWE